MALSPEDLASLTEALKPLITQVATEAAAGHVTKRNKSFEDKFDAFTTSISGKFAPPEPDEEKVTLTTRMNQLEAQNKKLLTDLSEEKQQGRIKNMRSTLSELLTQRKVPAEFIKAITSQLIHEDKKVFLDNEGNANFKGVYDDEVMTLDEGVDSWLKSEGKAFLPQPNQKGIGARPIRANTTRTTASETGFANQEEADDALVDLVRQSRG